MMSPSMPTTSMTSVTRRTPSRIRLTCRIKLTAAAIWVRTACEGKLIPVIPTMFSSRVSASRGRLAWIVLIEPSCPVWAHAQGVAQQVAHRDLAGAFEVGRAGLQPHDVGLLQLQLGGILDRHGALGRVDQPRQRVQQGRLAGSRATRN